MNYQLDLFAPEIRKVKKIFFKDLNVHQKINYKANQCGFILVYKSFYNFHAQPLFQPVTDALTPDYWWHYRVNSGCSNRLQLIAQKDRIKRNLN